MANETSIGTRDVNAEFGASKMQQIQAATDKAAWIADQVKNKEMKDLGNNRFLILTGWDRGEIIGFNANKATQVTAQHGLDTNESGDVALYLKGRPAWHGLGTVFKDGLSSASGVLKAAGLDWDTLLTPQEGTNPVTGERDEYASGFHTRRGDTGAILGSVGSIYTPLHNREAYAFLDGLFQAAGEFGMVADSGGSFRGGQRVFITAEMNREMLVDPNGFSDHIRMFLAIINSHNGSSPLMAVVTPWRVECGNTERFAIRDAVSKWTVRHTKNAKNKLEIARQTLGLTNAYYAAWQEEEMSLVQTPFTDNEIDALCDQVWGELDTDAAKRTVTLDTNRRETVREIWRMERDRCGSNAYAAERAITGYADHYQELRPRNDLKGNPLAALGAAIMEGNQDDTKSKAHKALLTLRNR
jgi:phage/plasmid-like protein (TIGR03299 family)